MNYSQAISFLQSFPDLERGLPGTKSSRFLKMPLSTMVALLKSMGDPQNNTKTIHITGSKGKGSTATFITSILNKAGYRTALFTSPHLHSYCERIAFDLNPISENLFAEGISEIKPYIEDFDKNGHTISTFGILNALFFHLVNKADPPIDWQIVEVGLGGKDDLTNVFTNKEAAVITPISLEHTAILGPTKKDIAQNKAGIITPGCIVISAPQEDIHATETIKTVCAEKKAELLVVDSTPLAKQALPLLKMPGDHQITNALTAIALARALTKKGHKIAVEAIRPGLSSAFLPGRFEIIELRNNSDIIIPIILDGAHNNDSARALTNTLEAVFPNRPVLFILGTNQDKNLEDIWLELKNKACGIIATRSVNYKALPPEEIKQRILACDSTAQVVCSDNIDQSLGKANNYLMNNNDKVICICGSFYLIAEARERLLDGNYTL